MTTARVWRDLHPKVKRGVLATIANVTVTDGVATNANGDDVSHIVEVKPKLTAHQIRRNEARDVLTEHEAENDGFVFAFFSQSRVIEERFPSLSKPDIARLMFIGTYTSWGDGKLQYANGRNIDKDGLHALVNMSRKRFNEFYLRLIDESIVQDAGADGLFMNPSVFVRGSVKSSVYDVSDLQYTRMFRQTIRDLYEAYNGRSLGQLALIYAVMPFVNFKTNIVAYNAEVPESKDVRPLSLDQLAMILDYADGARLKSALNRVRAGGQPVFGFFENPNDRRTWRIIVNPCVIYAAGGEELGAIKALFS